MRLERRWILTAFAALVMGALGASLHARIMAPYYRAAAALIAKRSWNIDSIDVSQDAERPGEYLRLHGEIPSGNTAGPAARLVTRVQTGAAIEAPVIFWTLLLAWRGLSRRARMGLMLLSVPVFLGLEAATTVCQLLMGFSAASAILAGDPHPTTFLERWSAFLESGGRDVLAAASALLTIAIASKWGRARATQPLGGAGHPPVTSTR